MKGALGFENANQKKQKQKAKQKLLKKKQTNIQK